MTHKKRYLPIFITSITISACSVGSVFASAETLPQSTSLKNLLALLIAATICGIPILIALGALLWQFQRNKSSQDDGARLAEAMGLKQLNQHKHKMGVWYGGTHQGRRFAIKPYGSKTRTFSHIKSGPSISFLLRIVMAVQVSTPLGVVVYRGHKDSGKAVQSFEDAFYEENASRLGGRVREALLAFVQKGHAAGLQGTTYRLGKGVRNLRLRDRATAPDGLLAPEVLANTPVIFVYDHPNTKVSAETFQTLLDEMAAVVLTIERAA